MNRANISEQITVRQGPEAKSHTAGFEVRAVGERGVNLSASYAHQSHFDPLTRGLMRCNNQLRSPQLHLYHLCCRCCVQRGTNARCLCCAHARRYGRP